MTGSKIDKGLGMGHMDWWAVALYGALVVIGWVNIYAAVYNETHGAAFDLGQRYGMQMLWIGVSLAVAVVILLLDDKYWHMLAYPFYGVAVVVLLATLFFGREINGAKAWIVISRVALQPCEFVKFTTALALARYMSRYSFNIHKGADLFNIALILPVPVAIIFLQNDTGSAVVYGAFLFVLYREGLDGWVYVALIMAIMLFLASFLLTPETILISLVVVCALGEGLMNGHWKQKAIYLSSVAMGTILTYFAWALVTGGEPSLFWALLASVALSLVFVVMYAYRRRLRSGYIYVALF
ncbi:MAG: rod shape-determining protein RodA, partial [Alistipes sp.]|nr:rod shape-determining protein RodA [Alistipes sp.]